MKKVALVVAVLTTLTSVLSGCKGGTTTDKPTTNEQKVPEKLSIRAMVPNFGISSDGTMIQQEWLARMEKYLGTKLDISWEMIPWADYPTKEKTVLASGDIPDVFTYSNYDMNQQYGSQGVLLDVAKYLDKSPNYKKFVDSTPDSKYLVYTPEGKSYGFLDGFVNTKNIEGAQSLSTVAYRFDIFKKENIKIPETLDEFYDAAKKLKALYPNAYPINISSKNFTLQRAWANIYHTNDNLYWNGKEYIYGPTEDSYKEMLMYLNQLYKDKLVDPEFVTDTDDKATQKAVSGKTFMFPSVWAGTANNCNKNSKDMEWGLAMLPTNSKYGTPWKLLSTNPGNTLQQRFGIAISAKTKNPDLVVKMVDYQYSDEMIQLMNWGIEGKTYQKKADGSLEFLPEIKSAPDQVRALGEKGVSSSGVCRSGIVFTPQDFTANIAQLSEEPWYNKGQFVKSQYWIATEKFGGKESIAPFDRAPVLSFSKDEQTQKATASTAAYAAANEGAVKFITGQVGFDKWDEYKANIEKVSNIQPVIKMMNDKYKNRGK
jgi:putative aldouronate transport system substrate-binding protein